MLSFASNLESARRAPPSADAPRLGRARSNGGSLCNRGARKAGADNDPGAALGSRLLTGVPLLTPNGLTDVSAAETRHRSRERA